VAGVKGDAALARIIAVGIGAPRLPYQPVQLHQPPQQLHEASPVAHAISANVDVQAASKSLGVH